MAEPEIIIIDEDIEQEIGNANMEEEDEITQRHNQWEKDNLAWWRKYLWEQATTPLDGTWEACTCVWQLLDLPLDDQVKMFSHLYDAIRVKTSHMSNPTEDNLDTLKLYVKLFTHVIKRAHLTLTEYMIHEFKSQEDTDVQDKYIALVISLEQEMGQYLTLDGLPETIMHHECADIATLIRHRQEFYSSRVQVPMEVEEQDTIIDHKVDKQGLVFRMNKKDKRGWGLKLRCDAEDGNSRQLIMDYLRKLKANHKRAFNNVLISNDYHLYKILNKL